MKTIGKGSDLILKLKENNALLDGRIICIRIFEDNGSMLVQIDLEPRPGSYTGKLRIEFHNIKEFSFYYDDSICFYYIECYKFFSTLEEEYYLSIDPYDEGEYISNDDRGVIRAKEVIGFLL